MVRSTFGQQIAGITHSLVFPRRGHSGKIRPSRAVVATVDGEPRLAAPVQFTGGEMLRTLVVLLIAFVAVALEPARAQSYAVVHSFGLGTDGSQPLGSLISDSAGNLYGTTYSGGDFGAGTVFELDADGNETVLYSFTGGADGRNPEAGVTRDSAGNLYGTANGGGIANDGTVFKLDPAGHETVLHDFVAGIDGVRPTSGVVLDAQGSLYGTTTYGGPYGYGMVYKLTPGGKEILLYAFRGGADGALPQSHSPSGCRREHLWHGQPRRRRVCRCCIQSGPRGEPNRPAQLLRRNRRIRPLF